MNIKHAKALRACAINYIARTINQTPNGMHPDFEGIKKAADQLQSIVLELWPKLNHRQCGEVATRLELSNLGLNHATFQALLVWLSQ